MANWCLALISDDDVKLWLRLAKVTFDFPGTGKNRTTLLDILAELNGGRFLFEIANPEIRIHFDRGDVAWLHRMRLHLLAVCKLNADHSRILRRC